jgi:transcriptional repressor NrdR
MQCPFCKQDDDRVVNSRASTGGTAVKRRRECLRCGRRFTTYERIEGAVLRVVKKDGGRENFSRAKLLEGLMRACHKRPVSTDTLQGVVDEIERELHNRFDSEVPSKVIGELVMDRLRKLDEVAFIRFASVYREFKDVTDFLEEAGEVLGKGRPVGRKRTSESRRQP